MISQLGEELRTAMESASSTSIAHKGNGWCTLIEASEPGDAQPPFWIQLHAGMINFQYLDEEAPEKVLPEEGVHAAIGSSLAGWEANLFCTFDVSEAGEQEIEHMVRTILEGYYGLGADCKIQISTSNLT